MTIDEIVIEEELEEDVRCMSSHKVTGGNEVISMYYKACATARQYHLRLVNRICMEED